jgi:hypothetical protein
MMSCPVSGSSESQESLLLGARHQKFLQQKGDRLTTNIAVALQINRHVFEVAVYLPSTTARNKLHTTVCAVGCGSSNLSHTKLDQNETPTLPNRNAYTIPY